MLRGNGTIGSGWPAKREREREGRGCWRRESPNDDGWVGVRQGVLGFVVNSERPPTPLVDVDSVGVDFDGVVQCRSTPTRAVCPCETLSIRLARRLVVQLHDPWRIGRVIIFSEGPKKTTTLGPYSAYRQTHTHTYEYSVHLPNYKVQSTKVPTARSARAVKYQSQDQPKKNQSLERGFGPRT